MAVRGVSRVVSVELADVDAIVAPPQAARVRADQGHAERELADPDHLAERARAEIPAGSENGSEREVVLIPKRSVDAELPRRPGAEAPREPEVELPLEEPANAIPGGA
jgi:hypothetical protein